MTTQTPPEDKRFPDVPNSIKDNGGTKDGGERQAPLSTEQDLAIDHGKKRDLVVDDVGAGTGESQHKEGVETPPPPGPSRGA